MNIVVAQRITLTHGIKGGLEVQSDTLCRGLVARGHNVEVITTAHPHSLRESEEVGIRTHYLPNTDSRRYSGAWWRASYAKLRELVYRGRADVLLSQSAGALGYLPRARRELQLPAVLLVHMALGASLDSQWRAARSPRGLARFVYTLTQIPSHYWLWRRALAAADATIAVSNEVAHDLRAEFGTPRAQLHVIPNGVDTRTFAPSPEARRALRAELGIENGQFVAVLATRLAREKGVQIALRALTHAPQVQLLVAGDGPYAAALQRQARELNVSHRARFAGFVPHAKLPAYLAAADAFVLPTLYREGLPVSVVEALASGLPVIASHLGGIPTVVTPGRTGMLVPPGSPEALAEALSALAEDSERRAALAAAARAEALERLSVERMVDDTLAVLLEAAAQARPRAG